jgi:hypothetical protein
VTYRSRRTRLTSALLVLLGCWILAPLLFLIPPHLPWGLGALVAGLFLAYRRWTGEYVVHSFEGRCPGCDGSLTMKPDQLVQLPHTMPCYNCHQEPELKLSHPGA